MKRTYLPVLLIAVSGQSAFACGYCVEDKVASVYDHAIVVRAEAAKHHVAFCAIEGSLPPGEETRRLLERAAAAAPGVIARSIRISIDNAALSFAFDPERVSVESAVRSANRDIAARGWRLEPMRVMERTATLKDAPR